MTRLRDSRPRLRGAEQAASGRTGDAAYVVVGLRPEQIETVRFERRRAGHVVEWRDVSMSRAVATEPSVTVRSRPPSEPRQEPMGTAADGR